MMYLIWLLRIIHIVGGVLWVGGTLVMTFFIGPTVGAIGEPGQKFLSHLMNNLKFSNRMAIASGSTVLAGFILYLLDARAGEAWVRSSFAIGLGIGAGFALIGFVAGILIGRTMRAMVQLGGQIQGMPSPDQMNRLQKLRNQQSTYSMISTVTLVLATIFMAVARYL